MMDIVTITGYTLVAALIGGGVGYLLGDQHRAKRDAVEIWAMRQQRDESRAQRDRLNERNSTLAGELEEAGRANGELQLRIQGFQQTERNYLNRIAQLDAALKLAQAKASGDASEHDTQPDTTPEPTNEAQFTYIPPDERTEPTNGKKPANANRKRRISVKSVSDTAGTDV